MVFTDVTIEDITHEMWLPVMDGANKTMLDHPYTYQVKEYKDGKATGRMIEKSVEAATMFDVNKTIMRCLTKNLAMFGLGLSLYQGEDLPTIATKEEAEKLVITFGKHQGKTLGDLVKTQKNYIEWLYANTKDENIKLGIELLTERLTDEQQEEAFNLIAELNDLLEQTNTDRDKFYEYYKVKSNNDMSIEQLKHAKSVLKQKLGDN